MAAAKPTDNAPRGQVQCERCGNTFAPLGRRGRKPRFCSQQCRDKYFNGLKPLLDLTCRGCGKAFQTVNAGQRFCSRSCAQRCRQTKLACQRTHPTCRHCGKEYRPKQPSRKTFCSRGCAFAWKKARAAKKPERTVKACAVCGRGFWPRVANQTTCCRACRRQRDHDRVNAAKAAKRRLPRQTHCLVCGKGFIASVRGLKQLYCCRRCCKKAARKRERAYYRAQNRLHAAVRSLGENINPYEIFERDGWKCQLCGRRIDRKAVFPDYLSAVLDHIVPISKGGLHTRQNVQCAHFICNSRRSDTGPAQMLLFG